MVKEVSKFDNISINQFITAAIGEKLTALHTENYLEKRSKKGSKEKFLSVLDKAWTSNLKNMICNYRSLFKSLFKYIFHL